MELWGGRAVRLSATGTGVGRAGSLRGASSVLLRAPSVCIKILAKYRMELWGGRAVPVAKRRGGAPCANFLSPEVPSCLKIEI